MNKRTLMLSAALAMACVGGAGAIATADDEGAAPAPVPEAQAAQSEPVATVPEEQAEQIDELDRARTSDDAMPAEWREERVAQPAECQLFDHRGNGDEHDEVDDEGHGPARVPSLGGQALFAALATWFLLLAAPRTVLELQTARRRRSAKDSDADQLARLTPFPALLWVGVFLLVDVGALVLGARWLLA